jgi:hypothetical protein
MRRFKAPHMGRKSRAKKEFLLVIFAPWAALKKERKGRYEHEK